MKLIDILVEELPKRGGWPEGAARLAQDPDGDIQMLSNRHAYLVSVGWTGDVRTDCYGQYAARKLEPLASDYATAIITREQYEAALAAKNDGWIEWSGGECPVQEGVLVKVKYRNEKDNHIKGTNCAWHWSWEHYGFDGDIIAYRLHKQKEEEQDKANLNECIGQDATPAWSGEGLPPVGCFCEVEDLEGMLVYGQGESGEVIAHVENTAVIRMSYGLGCFEARFLRPLRTEAERRRDESIKAMASAPKPCGHPIAGICSEIYDAIVAGKIPGVKMED